MHIYIYYLRRYRYRYIDKDIDIQPKAGRARQPAWRDPAWGMVYMDIYIDTYIYIERERFMCVYIEKGRYRL